MDNFDLRKYLVENKATTNSKMLTEQVEDTMKIKDFVYSHPEYEGLSPEELATKVQEYKEEWESVSGNYSSIEDYFDEIENRGDFLQEGHVLNFEEEAKQFPQLVSKYGTQAVADALEAIYINAEDAAKESEMDADTLYLNQIDSFKEDASSLENTVKDSL